MKDAATDKPRRNRADIPVNRDRLDAAAQKVRRKANDLAKVLVEDGVRRILEGDLTADPGHSNFIADPARSAIIPSVDDIPLTSCAAAGRNSDGDCNDTRCPQNRDGEPALSGRHCPLDRG